MNRDIYKNNKYIIKTANKNLYMDFFSLKYITICDIFGINHDLTDFIRDQGLQGFATQLRRDVGNMSIKQGAGFWVHRFFSHDN